ncbi:MAG: efflux RND transporter periplasmic adaptor subunit [Flavobacteriia bacterium]
MNSKTSILKKVLIIIIPLGLVAIFIIKLKTNKEITQNKVYTYDKEKAINIEVDTLKLSSIDNEFSYSGIFEPNKETKLSSESQGKINKVMVDVGSLVKKGQTLVVLDNSLLKLQLQSVEVQISGLEADVNRYTILAKSDAIQGVQLEKAELGLKTAKIQKATLIEQIRKTTIQAPFDGVITAKLSEEGAFASPGIPLLQLTDITNIKFNINVSENELHKFKLNTPYSISVDSYSDLFLSAKVTLIGSKANMGNSFPIQFLVKNTTDLSIKSGMFGKVKLQNKSNEQKIIISSSAILGTSDKTQVYVVKNGKVYLKDIEISDKYQNKAIVKSGLKEGDVLVVKGFINLFEGANVSVN